jgi:hypothetical protein
MPLLGATAAGGAAPTVFLGVLPKKVSNAEDIDSFLLIFRFHFWDADRIRIAGGSGSHIMGIVQTTWNDRRQLPE